MLPYAYYLPQVNLLESRIMTAASSLPPVRTSCHVPLSLMTSISEETIALWLKLGALEKLEQAVLDGYGDQLCGKNSRIPQVNKFLKQVPLFQNKIREIHQAVSQGRLRDVQHLIDRKKLAFCRDHNGASPLHKAVIFGHLDVIDYLVRRYGGVIHIRDHQGRTALHYAAFLPDRGEIYQYLLAAGADERAMDVYGRQPSYYLDGQNESTLRQLRNGTNLNGIRKIKPRYYSQISAGHTFSNASKAVVTKSQIRELILEDNLNALENLVLQGQGDRLLGETSSNPRIQSFLNIVPMYMERIYDVHRAVMRDQMEHVVVLLANRQLAMGRDQLGATPLHKAVWFGHYKIAHYISQQFPETVNAIDLEGRTALHYAAALKDNKNMYAILLEAGANKGAYDNKGKTADYYAQYPEHLNLEEVIKRCHKVNANYLANTASRLRGKSPIRHTPPPQLNGCPISPRSEESAKDQESSNESRQENELISKLQKDAVSKRFDVNSANIRRWVKAKDIDKLERAVLEGYGDKVIRIEGESEDKDEDLTGKVSQMVDRINAIHNAVSSDDLNELQNHLCEQDFVLGKDHMGMTPLHKAVLLRKANIVKYLIESFPEAINSKNKNGLTALHYAAAMSRKDGQQIYKMLIQAGADLKIRDNHGRTPDYYKTHLMTLPSTGTIKVRSSVGRHNESLNRYSKQGVMERMTTALQRGDVDLLQELVLEGHGKHLLGKTSWNEDVKAFLKELPSYLNSIQSLYAGVKAGDVQKVRTLVENNEKLLRARDENGAAPIHVAAVSESADVLEYFAENYPNTLNIKDGAGRTALHIISQLGKKDLCKMLKEKGADSKILDQKGRTADYYLQVSRADNVKTRAANYTAFTISASPNVENSNREVLEVVKTSQNTNKDKIDSETTRDQNNDENNIKNLDDSTSKDEETIKENKNIELKTKSPDQLVSTPKPKEIQTDTLKDDNESKSKNENSNDDDNEKNLTTDDSQDKDEKIIENIQEDIEDVKMNNKEFENKLEDENIDEGIDKNRTESEDMVSEKKFKEKDASLEKTHSEESNEKSEEKENVDETNEPPIVEEQTDNDANIEKEDNDHEVDVAEENPQDASDSEADKHQSDTVPIPANEDEIEANLEEDVAKSEDMNDDVENVTEQDDIQKVKQNSTGITVAEVGSGQTLALDTGENVNSEDIQDTCTDDKDKISKEDSQEQTAEIIENIESLEHKNESIKNEMKVEEGEESKAIASIKDDANDNEKTEEGEKPPDKENMQEEEITSNEQNLAQQNSIELDENNDLNEKSMKETVDLLEDSNKGEGTKSQDMNENIDRVEDINKYEENCPDGSNNNPENDETNQNDSQGLEENEEKAHIEQASHHTKDHLDELIEHWIKEGDLLRLEHVVLAGQGDRLIERTSEDKQVQDFLDLVPIYMAKIRAVHEAVAKGQLREVRSVLTRKRFALSRDHVGASPLHLAVLHGHTDVSTYIISHFPETMDGPDNEGRTPLHYATALQDNGTLYKLLKAAGADENAEDKAGHSPKFYMSQPGLLTIEQLLEPYSSTE